MEQDISPDDRSRAIAVILEGLRHQLTYALEQATDACVFAQSGEQNSAIGSIVALREVLGDADALYRAAIALHCMNLRPPLLRPADAGESTQVSTRQDRHRRDRYRFLTRFFRGIWP